MENIGLKLQNMCRTCKVETVSMISIDQEEICDNNVITPANMLMECTSVKVSPTPDGLPREICVKCMHQLKSAFTFKKQCEDTDTFLRQYLIDSEIKPEDWNIDEISVPLEEGKNNNDIKEEPDDQPESRKRKRSKQTREPVDPNQDVSKRGRIRKPVIKYEPESELSEFLKIRDTDDFETGADVFIDSDDDKDWTASDNEVITRKSESETELTEEPKKEVKNKSRNSKKIRSKGRKVKNKEENVGYKCTQCSMKFKNKLYLKQHQSIHDDETPFLCEICPEKFGRRDQLIEHTKGHLDELDHDCEVCGQKLETIEQLVKHKFSTHHTTPAPAKTTGVKKEKEKFKCDTCGKLFSSLKHRENHVYLAHTKVYYCKTCTLPFSGREAFYIHNTRSNECSKRYLCPDCGARFSATSALKVHIRRHRGEKPFKCQYCEKGFSRKFDLITHETRHRGEKNHLCPICGKGFNRRHMLTIHMRVHTGEKPYKCSYCEAAFTQNNDLKTHIRRHTGERFLCDICNEKFLMHYLLSKHKRIVHGINIPPAKPVLERVVPGEMDQSAELIDSKELEPIEPILP